MNLKGMSALFGYAGGDPLLDVASRTTDLVVALFNALNARLPLPAGQAWRLKGFMGQVMGIHIEHTATGPPIIVASIIPDMAQALQGPVSTPAYYAEVMCSEGWKAAWPPSVGWRYDDAVQRVASLDDLVALLKPALSE